MRRTALMNNYRRFLIDRWAWTHEQLRSLAILRQGSWGAAASDLGGFGKGGLGIRHLVPVVYPCRMKMNAGF